MPDSRFAGDTVTVFAGFAGKAPAQLSFVGGANGSVAAAHTELADIPRLAAQARIVALGEKDAELALALALRHQLLTRRTNFLVVAERKEKAEDLPELQKVPHMMPAGLFESASQVSYSMAIGVPSCIRHSSKKMPSLAVDYRRVSHDDLSDSFDSPVVAEAALPDPVQRSIRYDFMDHSVASEPLERIGLLNLPAASSPGEFVANLNRMLARFLQVQELPCSIEEIESYGLPGDIASALRLRSDLIGDEALVVIAFLHALSDSALSGDFARGLRRLVLTAWKRICADTALDQWLAASLAASDGRAWNWIAIPLSEEASTTT
jgi:hypothetical protein